LTRGPLVVLATGTGPGEQVGLGFNGDQMTDARGGGVLSVQACADDRRDAFHAVCQLSRHAHGVAQLRWAQTGEFDPLDLDAADQDGNLVIPEKRSFPSRRSGEQRRRANLSAPYSYNDGLSITRQSAGRLGGRVWPVSLDYFFVCYQRDPGFIKVFEKMPQFDMLNQFVTHTGGGHPRRPAGLAHRR
jgi:hypothetical protein